MLRGVDIHVPAETIVSMMGRNGVGQNDADEQHRRIAQTVVRIYSDRQTGVCGGCGTSSDSCRIGLRAARTDDLSES